MNFYDVAVVCEDRIGSLADLGEMLGAAGINIEGLWTHVREDEAHIHILVTDHAAVERAISAKGWRVHKWHEVLVAPVENHAGWLGMMCRRLAEAGLNIEWCYTATDNRVVISCKDLAKARQVWEGAAAGAR